MNDKSNVTSYNRWRIEKRIADLEAGKAARLEEVARIDKQIMQLRNDLERS